MSINDLLDRPAIAVLKRTEGMPLQMEMFLAAQIKKLVDSVNINSNLTIHQYQIPSIAAQLIEMFPVESLEDFVLCFKRGALAFYGTIYKLDASVLCEWMKMYLDEKYQLVEAKAKQQKQDLDESNNVNYEAFKQRVGDFLKVEKKNNVKENEIQRMKLENPYRYFDVRGLQIYAKSQEHAEELVQRLIKLGELEEVKG